MELTYSKLLLVIPHST